MRRTSQKQAEPLPERLWTIQETSTFLGVPVSTLYHWNYRDEGPKPYKVGRHLRYDPRAVMRWLEDSAA
jgi:predicted DNA-binding transcriptional regulator AlpA